MSSLEEQRQPLYQNSKHVPTLIAALSILLNIILILRPISLPTTSHEDRSLYAHLARDVPTTKTEGAETLFGHPNRTIADAAWSNWRVDPGIIALPKSLVADTHPPRSQKWPWDHDKGIYLVNGFHALHCLHNIRSTLLGAIDGTITADSSDEHGAHMLEHSLHCIESLRQDALCNANDTPLYTGFNKERLAGVQQQRLCRSWDKLEAWVRQYTACCRDVGRGVKAFPQIEKYKFCPEGYVFSATGSTIAPWDVGNGATVD